MTIITTVSGKRIRLRPKKSGPKPLPKGVKKCRINICLSPHWHKVGKKKAAAGRLSFSEYLEKLI